MTARSKWTNQDGLDVYFGKRYTENQVPASLGNPALGQKVVEMIFRGEDLLSDGASPDQRGVIIPAGARIISSTLVVAEAFASSGAGTLDLGTFKVSDGTAKDEDGLDVAIASTALTANAVVVGDGAQVGTVMTEAVRINPSYNTLAFTAGAAKLMVIYDEPLAQTT